MDDLLPNILFIQNPDGSFRIECQHSNKQVITDYINENKLRDKPEKFIVAQWTQWFGGNKDIDEVKNGTVSPEY